MSLLQFACPYCSGMFQVEARAAGGEAMCPLCQGVVTIPAELYGPPPSDAPPVDFVSPPVVALGCPHCGNPFQADATLAGHQVQCPTCGGLAVVPGMDAPPDHASAPPAPSPPAIGPPPWQPSQLEPQPPTIGAGPWTTQSANPLPPGFDRQDAQPAAAGLAPVGEPRAGPLLPLSARQSVQASEPPESASKPHPAERKNAGDEKRPRPAPASQNAESTASLVAAVESPEKKRSAKIEPLLPEEADPTADVVAERPTALAEPPSPDDTGLDIRIEEAQRLDEAGQPIRPLARADRERQRVRRNLILFALGMVILLAAVVLLPRMGIVIDLADPPKR